MTKARSKSAASTTPTVRDQIRTALDGVDRPALFMASGHFPLVLPGLEVDGVGTISLPMPKTQAKNLIKVCRQAPYGKGEDTLVDTRVRRVWELDPEKFQLTSAGWNDALDLAVWAVQQQLGIEEQKLKSQLYKLLVYETGSFFLPHKDSEKINGMVATCVLTLPSEHTGGQLVIRHDGQERIVDFSKKQYRNALQFAAFYADCEHEVRPVKSGYRLSLVYNLVIGKSRRKGIKAPTYDGAIGTLTDCFREWAASTERGTPTAKAAVPDRPPSEDSVSSGNPVVCLAMSLQHEYTQAGLAPKLLKGADRARADVIRAAATQAGCRAYVGLVTLYESGYAEDHDADHYYRRRGRYARYDDDEDDDDDGSGDYTMVEVYEYTLEVSQLVDFEGNQLPAALSIEESCFLDATALREVTPEEEYEGFTGNAGNTLERWYRHAVILVWPEAQHYAMLCRAGTAGAVAALEALTKQLAKAAKKRQAEMRDECLRFAESIVSEWKTTLQETDVGNRMLRILRTLGDTELTIAFFETVVTPDPKLNDIRTMRQICREAGWDDIRPALIHLVAKVNGNHVGRTAALLYGLCQLKDKDESRQRVCTELIGVLVNHLAEAFLTNLRNFRYSIELPDRSATLAALVKAVLLSGDEPDQRAFVRFVIDSCNSHEEVDLCKALDVRDVQIPVLVSLKPWLAKTFDTPPHSISAWLEHCLQFLNEATRVEPAPPSDWVRDPITSCSCRDCKSLSEFLQNADEEIGRFPLAKARRQHLHQQIEWSHADATHTTERKGSPQVLVCRKTDVSFQRRLKTWKDDVKQLKTLQPLAAGFG